MFRNAVLASAFVLSAAAGANAAELVNVNGDLQVIYAAPSHNVVGGGAAALSGDAESRSVTYRGVTSVQAPSERVATIVGGGDEQQVVHVPEGRTNRMIASAPNGRRGG